MPDVDEREADSWRGKPGQQAGVGPQYWTVDVFLRIDRSKVICFFLLSPSN